MTRKNPETSIDAYKSLKASEVRETYQRILETLDILGKGTFEDIAAVMKCSRDKIWRRLSEMERLEMIYRPGTKKVLKSGRSGYEWARTNPSKTESQRKEVVYKSSEKTAADFAMDIINSATKPVSTQLNLL